MDNIYIHKETINNLNNYQLLVFTTENYTQLLYFLEQERDYKNIKMKIGNFEYDGEDYEIYCILNEYGVSFSHIRISDNREWNNKSLTEQLIYSWGFEETQFNINFDIINNFWKILNKQDKEIYSSLYDEAHSKFW